LVRNLRRPGLAVGAGLIAVGGGLAVPQMATGATTAPAAAQSSSSGLSSNQLALGSRVVGQTQNGRSVTGHYTPRHFKTHNGHLKVRGVLHAVVHNSDGTVRRITQTGVVMKVKTIVEPQTGTSGGTAGMSTSNCEILKLVLAPLDLNLLGLHVHLDKVVLHIWATSGSGQLLGNLLCAVAHLLDGSQLANQLNQVAALLNSILAILNA
jgi:hypothetical protein